MLGKRLPPSRADFLHRAPPDPDWIPLASSRELRFDGPIFHLPHPLLAKRSNSTISNLCIFLSPCATFAHGSASASTGSAPRARTASPSQPAPNGMPIRAEYSREDRRERRGAPRIEQNGSELDTHAVVARNRLVQHRLAIVGGAVMRPAARQDQPKAPATLACC